VENENNALFRKFKLRISAIEYYYHDYFPNNTGSENPVGEITLHYSRKCR
jgi:hypothetical protein